MSSSTPGGSTVQLELVDQIASVVVTVPGVHDLHAGSTGQVATYLPGRRVNGVRAIDGGYAVHVVLAWSFPAFATAEAVRAVVQLIAPGRVDVTIEDVAAAAVHQL